MSSRDKGNRARRKSIALLEGLGYEVAVVERTGKFVKVKDMFGLFDLVAVDSNSTCFVQVTCNKPHTHKVYKDFAKKYRRVTVIQHVWKDGGKLVTYLYDYYGEVIKREASGRLTKAVRKAAEHPDSLPPNA